MGSDMIGDGDPVVTVLRQARLLRCHRLSTSHRFTFSRSLVDD